MKHLSSLIYNQWFYPLMVIYYGILYSIFGEHYPKMLSIDGRVFMSFVADVSSSPYFDMYYVHRVFPSLVIRYSLKLLSLEVDFDNAFKAFQVMAFMSIAISCFFLKKIFVQFKVQPKNQFLGLTLFIFSFAVIKYPFYLPVMTDTFALMLSVLMFFFYIKKNTWGVALITIIMAFSWPMGFYQGLILIALPFAPMQYAALPLQQKNRLRFITIMFAIIVVIGVMFFLNKDTEVPLVMHINKGMLPLSIAVIIGMFYFFNELFFNASLFNFNSLKNKLWSSNVLIAIGVLVATLLIVKFSGAKPTALYSTEQMLRDPIVHSLIRPFISVIADMSYFGVAVCLFVLFWKSICKFISQLGWGLVAAIALDLFLFGITPQTRHLNNLFPWLIVFLIKAIDKYKFSNAFYTLTVIIAIFISHVWFRLANFEAYPPMQLDRNGSMGFPQQKFWMHVGPWMSEDMYLLQGFIFILIVSALFFTLYKVERSSSKIIVLPKFK